MSPMDPLSQIEAGDNKILRSQSEGLTAADVEQRVQKQDLTYEGILDCFSRKWKLSITGSYKDYMNTALRLNTIVFVIVFLATILICISVLFTIVKNYQKLLLSDTHISKLEVESQKLDAEKTAMERFLHMTSHDLRTPIQAIVNSTQLLSRGLKSNGNAYLSELVNICRSSCMMLDLIISNTMDSAKIQSGKEFDMVLETAYDLEGAVEDLMLTLDASTTGKKSVQIVRNIQLAGLGPVRCDSRKIMRVILNMVSNAVKFTSSGDVVVHMFYKPPKSGNKVDLHFAVSDSGRGMTPDEVQNACKPYVRAKSSQGGGTGLGLYICRSFVEACRGAMHIESTFGVGTVVSFTLPVERHILENKTQQPKSGEEGTKVTTDDNKESVASKNPDQQEKDVVLVADESPINVRLIKILLEKIGHTVLVANDGEEALRVLTDLKSNVGIAILDLDLPKISLSEVVHRFKSWEQEQGDARNKVKLVALVTDEDDASKFFHGQAAKAFATTLYKPPTATDLMGAMNDVGECDDGSSGCSNSLFNSDSAVSIHNSSGKVFLHADPDDINLIPKFSSSKDLLHERHNITETDGKQPAVLVVDDNQVLLRLSVLMMRSFGYAVTSAVNGSEALSLMKSMKFDIVFMDIDMPLMQGDEAVQTYREWENENRAVDDRTTIVMMSGNIDERDIKHAIMVCGADDYITKPFPPEVLQRHVRNLVDRGTQ